MAYQESYQGLARKWRPQRFEDLVGQESVANSFQTALRQGRVVHGHLLAGPRGVGKTTSARILAKALNCEQGPTPTPCGVCRHCIDIVAGSDMDVIEIDAASNNKIEDVRDLREKVIQAPFSARFKVYIIDEVHQMSNAAFNALLKTLEEPPPNVIFIFATTELEKVPETIRSRCIVHNLRRLSAEDIARRLEQVAVGEGLSIEPTLARELYAMIARSVEGGMRDALVMFDQLIALTEGKPDLESATKLLGLADRGTLRLTVDWLVQGNAAELLKLIEELVDRGRSLERFIKSLIAYLRDLMLLQASASDGLVSLTGESLAEAKLQARQIAPETLFNILNQMFELEGRLKQSGQARFLIEFTILRIAAVRPVVPIDEILKRVRAIPEGTLSLAVAPAPALLSPNTPARQIAAAPAPSAAIIQAPIFADPAPVVLMTPSAPPPPSAEPEPVLRVAVMHDSAPHPPAAVSTSSPAPALAAASGEEVLERLIPQLPDVCRFLGRYLRQASELRLEVATLHLQWGPNAAMARRMIDKPENIRAIEETATLIYGRPIKVWCEDAAPRDTQPQDTPPPAKPAAAATWSPAKAEVFTDSSASWSLPMSDETNDGDPLASDGEADDDDAPRFVPRAAAPPSPERSGRLPEEPVPADRRSALQKAQAFLAGSEEATRRVKLLRDMLSGRLIDEKGEPLPI